MYFTIAHPNEVLIISGVGYQGRPRLISHGSALVVPCVHHVSRIPLDLLTIVIESPTVYTAMGVPISVTGVAQVRLAPYYIQTISHFISVYRQLARIALNIWASLVHVVIGFRACIA